MEFSLAQKSMNDAVGGIVVVGDCVAYAYGKLNTLAIGKIARFNDKSMIIKTRNGKEIRKISTQIIKITDDQIMIHLFQG